MAPGRNSVPLEKTLLSMDLSKGLNESARPEVAADQSKLLTILENLNQEQDGAWVCRPGVGKFGVTLDNTGATVGTVERMYSTQDGLALVDSDYRLYQYQEVANKLNRKGRVSEWSVDSLVVATNQTGSRNTAGVAAILATASNGYYSAVIYDSGANGTKCGAVLVIYDKLSGSQVGRYPLTPEATLVAGIRPQYLMTFVDNGNSLHIYTNDLNLGRLAFAQFSISGSQWPASGTTINFGATTIAVNVGGLFDIASTADTSVVVTGATGALSMDTAGGTHFKAGDWRSVDIDALGRVFLVGNDAGTGRVLVTVLNSYTNIAGGVAGTWVDPAITGTKLSCCVDRLSSVLMVLDQVTPAFGGTTIPAINVYTVTSLPGPGTLAAVGTLYGWKCAAKPFYVRDNLITGYGIGNGKPYVHLYKAGLLTATTSTHVLLSLDTTDVFTNNYGVPAGVGLTVKTFRCAAVLEPFNGIKAALEPRYVPYTDVFDGCPSVDTFIGYLGIQRSNAIGCYRLRMGDKKAQNGLQFAQETFVSGGLLTSYDGARAAENGIVDEPVITTTLAGGALTGSFNYVAVFRYLDARGNGHYSKVYGPVSVTPAAQTPTITIQPCGVTFKENGIAGDIQVVCELYRTASGLTQYYLVASSQIGAGMTRAGNYYSCVDTTTDATLITQSLLYRQPGTAGTALDRQPCPGNYGVICAHKDRLFTTDPYGWKVYYSSFFVDGEAPWFNAQLGFQVHGGTGPITGMASMDGRLIIFRKDAIFVVDGDGPPENGGSGAEFSPPTRIGTEFGCVDHRSIVMTPNGVMYRSNRGIELLTRSMQVVWIGQRVTNTVDAFPVTKGTSIFKGRVNFYLSSSDLYNPTGRTVVYDITQDCWSTYKYTFQSVEGSPCRGAAPWEITPGLTYLAMIGGDTSDEKVFYQHAVDGSLVTDPDNKPINWTVETGWIRPGGNLARFRFQDALFLAKRNNSGDPPTLTMSMAYDYSVYGSRIYSNSRVFDYTSIGSPDPNSGGKQLVELNLQPKLTTPVTFRMKVGSFGPALDVLGATFVVSPKAGATQVAESKKG